MQTEFTSQNKHFTEEERMQVVGDVLMNLVLSFVLVWDWGLFSQLKIEGALYHPVAVHLLCTILGGGGRESRPLQSNLVCIQRIGFY